MEALKLHKVLIPKEDHYRLLRAIYADDITLVLTQDTNAAKRLDACIKITMDQITPASKLYKVEMPDGTLIGFMLVTGEAMIVFFRIPFREQIYKDAFTQLAGEILTNGFFSSTGGNNYTFAAPLPGGNEIKNISFDFNVKNFVFSNAINQQS